MLQQPKLLKYAIIQFSKNIIKNAKETEIRHLKKLKNKLQNLINKLEQIQNTELVRKKFINLLTIVFFLNTLLFSLIILEQPNKK